MSQFPSYVFTNFNMEDNLKTILKIVTSTLSVAALVGCAPSGDQIKKAIEKDPSIVFVAIEKDPAKFIEVVNKAARDAQEGQAKKAQEEAENAREAEFKNPLQPEIDPKRAILGPMDAPITLVEYSDFECPFCKRGFETVEQVKKAYEGKIRFVFKHLPLDFHPQAMPAAMHFEAIARQSAEKAYKFHDEIFRNQADLKKGASALEAAAKKAGANMAQLKKDLADPTLMDRIKADQAEAAKFGISGTPGFIINGVSLKGAYPFEEFKSIIDRHLASKQ